ncbi:MAG: stalk domain-containing protein, partial [Niameybacter sp.]
YISGASLSWDSATKETKVSLEGKVYSFKAEDKVISGIGIDYPLSTPVLVRDSKTWVPMKAFMQAIGGDAEYNPTTRTMKVQLPLIEVERLNTPPVANFEFEAESYIEGQDFNVIEKSTDPDGHLLTDKKWKIEGQTTEYKSFNELKKHLQVGTNTISLKVKDSLDRWGEWTSKTVVIEANQAPVITKITTDKSSYSQGEPILFGDYEYENESWEQIVEEKWTYRAMDQAEGQLQENKPYKLFTEGKYQVTLQVKDSFGKWSVPYSMELLVTDEVIQSELMYRFTEGETGDILENYKSFNFQEFEAVIPSRATYTGATLLMSNSPESVGSKGVLYEDTFQGEGRILYHHKNNSTDDSKKRFVILMENTNTFPIKVVNMNESHKGPSTDVLYLGQQVTQDILGQGYEKQYTLEPGEKRYLYDTDKRNWYTGQTISGMIDLYSQSPLKVTIAMVGDQTEFKHLEGLSYLPHDGVHTRGTFPNADRYYSVEIDNKQPYKLMLGLPSGDIEQPITGYDALTGKDVINKGNYGVKYHIQIQTEENTGILLNPRGNIFKGAVGWVNGRSFAAPSGHLNGGKNAVTIGTVEPGKKKELLYMLPNGSSAPVLICFIPENMWNKY